MLAESRKLLVALTLFWHALRETFVGNAARSYVEPSGPGVRLRRRTVDVVARWFTGNCGIARCSGLGSPTRGEIT
jgi:hypothetical protein